MTLPIFAQHDKRWAEIKLGNSPYKMGEMGCLVTCVAMMASAYAIEITPGELCEKLNKISGFTEDGYLIHSKITEALDALAPYKAHHVFYERGATALEPNKAWQRTSMTAAISKIGHRRDIGFPQLLHVDAVAVDGRPDHWVVLKDAFNWQINDPAYGDSVDLIERYGAIEKAIFGWITIVGQPVGGRVEATVISKLLTARDSFDASKPSTAYARQMIDESVGVLME